MSCSKLVREAEQMNLRIEPNPIRTQGGVGTFEVSMNLTDHWRSRKGDSIKLSMYTSPENGALTLIGERSFPIRKNETDETLERITGIFQVKKPIPDSTRIFLQMSSIKKGRSRSTPIMEVAFTVEKERL